MTAHRDDVGKFSRSKELPDTFNREIRSRARTEANFHARTDKVVDSFVASLLFELTL